MPTLPAVLEVLRNPERPIFALDAAGKVQLFNPAMQRLTGFRDDEVLGQAWVERFTPAGHEARARTQVERALRGPARRAAWVAQTRDGERLRLRVMLARVGEPNEGFVAQVLAPAAPALELEPAARRACRSYVISMARGSEGLLRELHITARYVDPALLVGRRCYEVLEARDAPCDRCPAFADPQKPRTVVLEAQEGAYRIASSEPEGGDAVRVQLLTVSEPLLSALLDARVKQLGARARLSERERRVLELMVLGRRLSEIGSILGISARTAKFHQSNVLEKLGADSRVDLIRLLL